MKRTVWSTNTNMMWLVLVNCYMQGSRLASSEFRKLNLSLIGSLNVAEVLSWFFPQLIHQQVMPHTKSATISRRPKLGPTITSRGRPCCVPMSWQIQNKPLARRAGYQKQNICNDKKWHIFSIYPRARQHAQLYSQPNAYSSPKYFHIIAIRASG